MHDGHLHEIVVLLLAAVFIVAVFKRLHLSPVLGYLVAGGVIGPHGLELIQNVETTNYIAEFGVVFLLFIIGLELTFDRLKAMRWHVFGYGTLQMGITGGFFSLMAYYSGLVSIEAAIIIGFGLALSSTAVVLQVLVDQHKQNTQVGRLSIATLILQDLAVVPLLILVPLLQQENTDLQSVLLTTLGQSLLALLAIIIVGKQLLRPFFGLIAALKSEELFVATTLLIVLGAAWATGELGLSLALGAFMAGLLVAETEYVHQVEMDIRPFKGLLMGLFFMTIGMKIDFLLFYDQFLNILTVTVGLIVVKCGIIFVMSHFLGIPWTTSFKTGMMLAQGSEFGFVLFGLAVSTGLFSNDISQFLVIVISCSIAVTPLMSMLGSWIDRYILRRNPVHLDVVDVEKETKDLDSHVIIVGYHRVGRTLGQLLESKAVNFVVLDEDPKNVHEGRRMDVPVYYGSVDRADIIESLGVERARLVAVTTEDREMTSHAVEMLHKSFPNVQIVARAQDRFHAKELHELGAHTALAERFESSVLMGRAIFTHLGEPESEIERVVEQFRADVYPTPKSK